MIAEQILQAYHIESTKCKIEILSSGLINATWKITAGENEFVLQKINTNVFRHPERIAHNIELLANHLRDLPNYFFVAPLKNASGLALTTDNEGGVYRLFPFVKGSHTIDKVSTADEAFEAAAQFGKFTSVFSDFDNSKLQTTLPDFHNISIRYSHFISAISSGNAGRILKAKELIAVLKKHSGIIEEFEKIKHNPAFKQRVTHHDTKISNVLFDENGKGLCVIDLDTVMPGYFISDVGDMMRTYLSPTTEEETDLSKISIREDVYQAICSGYLKHMSGILSTNEQQNFFYAGTFLIYMQALRFITDYLNNDQYYGAKYPDQNFNRALNQSVLLERLLEKKMLLHSSQLHR